MLLFGQWPLQQYKVTKVSCAHNSWTRLADIHLHSCYVCYLEKYSLLFVGYTDLYWLISYKCVFTVCLKTKKDVCKKQVDIGMYIRIRYFLQNEAGRRCISTSLFYREQKQLQQLAAAFPQETRDEIWGLKGREILEVIIQQHFPTFEPSRCGALVSSLLYIRRN